jgi:hypothetical protein
MNRRISPLIFILCLAACAPLQPGADPIVVNAERTANLAADTFDVFLKLEYDNRAALQTLSPAIHQYAETLRAKGPVWLDSLRALTKAYKFNRTSENKASLQTAISVVTAAMTESSKYIGQINAKAATP